ncbi:MAG: M23 family metallopeptidase [Parabacteroides sp.]
MRFTLHKPFIIGIFLLLFACQTTRLTPTESIPPVTAKFPTTPVPFPAKDFKFLFPVASTLSELPSARKEITDRFSAREINELAVRDIKRFEKSNTEIFDLSLIAAEPYAFPLPGAKVISPFGGRRKHHTGVDLKTRANDTIVAAFDGVVRLSKPYAAYGNLVVIRHYNGLETVYSHNSKNLVKSGEVVKAGQPIALTGRTGRATTEHLHFEVRINGYPINPAIVFNMRSYRLYHKYLLCTQKSGSVEVKTLNILPHQRKGDYNRFAQTLAPTDEQE